MKLKEVCEKTGLSKKTIRFYEEKQLIFPEVRYQNGRNFREYSQKNVEDLLEIAILRKALFSIEDIFTMQQEPEEISAILQAHSERIQELYDHLKFLNHTMAKIDPEEITGVSDLAKELSGPARQLPLPSYDINPKFKYIDEMEIAELEQKNAHRQNKQGDSPFILDQQKYTVRKGLFNEHYTHNSALTGGSANFPKPQEAKALRVINLVISAVILACSLVIVYFAQQRKLSRVIQWNQIKGWIIPLDLAVITIRLMTSQFSKVFSEFKKNRILHWSALFKYCGILLSIFLLIGGGILLSRDEKNANIEPDFTLVVVNEETLSSEMVEEFEALLQSMIADYNQDDRIVSSVHVLNLAEQDGQNKLRELIASGSCSLFLLDDRSYNGVIQSIIKQSELDFAVLPEEMQSPISPVLCDISEAQFLSDIGLEYNSFFGIILCDTTQEENAVEILRKFQNARIKLWY